MADPRGSRASNGQGHGEHGQIGGLPRCHFCNEPMPGFEIPDHIRTDHFGGGQDA